MGENQLCGCYWAGNQSVRDSCRAEGDGEEMKALEPISIAGVEIPNRVVRTAHSTHFGSGGIVPSLIDYHVERARGGVGLTILEIAGVHPTCPSSICNFDDSVIDRKSTRLNSSH